MTALSAPAIPYLSLPHVVLVPAGFFGGFPSRPIAIEPFGVLVAIGVFFGVYFALRQGRRRKVNEDDLVSFLIWIAITGFVSAHMLDVIFYYPGLVLEDPWSLFRLWDGLSSFGGFTGAVLAGFAWRLRYRTPILAYADVVGSAFPVTWLFGRAGCALAHDHPGVASDAWFAVQFPEGGRLDLGLIELVFTVPLVILFVVLWRKQRPFGTYLALMALYYAPVRFLLDFWRAKAPVSQGAVLASADPRYAALTPAQWACLGLFLFGVGMGLYLLRGGGTPSASHRDVHQESEPDHHRDDVGAAVREQR
ncbi:MAG TPA: prolipoprotein diacylglyceryl transferase family protein [Polyangiaceae bacterium]|nr:prolipoprotein diacylglyceryl transferase family protein [Polyangiaceae bacterium]